MKKYLSAITLAGFVAILLLPLAALADGTTAVPAAAVAAVTTVAAAASPTTIDISGILTVVVQVATTGLLGLGGMLVNKLATKFHMEAQSALLNNAIAWACNAGESMLIQKIGSNNFANFDTHSAAVATAYNFLQATIPSVLTSLNLSPDVIQQMISGYFAKTNPAVVQPGALAIGVAAAPTAAPAS